MGRNVNAATLLSHLKTVLSAPQPEWVSDESWATIHRAHQRLLEDARLQRADINRIDEEVAEALGVSRAFLSRTVPNHEGPPQYIRPDNLTAEHIADARYFWLGAAPHWQEVTKPRSIRFATVGGLVSAGNWNWHRRMALLLNGVLEKEIAPVVPHRGDVRWVSRGAVDWSALEDREWQALESMGLRKGERFKLLAMAEERKREI